MNLPRLALALSLLPSLALAQAQPSPRPTTSPSWQRAGCPRVAGRGRNSARRRRRSAIPGLRPDSLMLGGQVGAASYYISPSFSQTIRCQPYCPLNIGTFLSLVMSDRPLAGTRAGIGPNGFAETQGYGNYDAANLCNGVGSLQPRFVASSEAVDPDGAAHAIT